MAKNEVASRANLIDPPDQRRVRGGADDLWVFAENF
jgi:hypothetical protein